MTWKTRKRGNSVQYRAELLTSDAVKAREIEEAARELSMTVPAYFWWLHGDRVVAVEAVGV